MKRKNATRNALFTSIISLLLCVSMLVGTTFAWFTDSVVSGNNTITAGNLDVELYYGKTTNPTEKVDASDKLFTDKNGELIELWEPGVVAYTNLKIANEGNLALTYQMAINFTNMNYVEHEGTRYTLADVLNVAVVPGGFTGGRAEANALDYNYTLSSFALNGVLEADTTTQTYGIVIYWEPNDNAYDNIFNLSNGKTTNDEQPLHVELGINLFATQEMYEEDSFGDDYDGPAALEMPKIKAETSTPDAFLEALTSGKTAVLGDDLSLDGDITIPAGATSAIDLNGKTLTLGANGGIEAAGNLILTGTGNIAVTAGEGGTYAGLVVAEGATMEIGNGVNIVTESNSIGVWVLGDLVVDGATIDASAGGHAIFTHESGDTNITINSGSVLGNSAIYIGWNVDADIVIGEDATVGKIVGGYGGTTANITYYGDTAPDVADDAAATITYYNIREVETNDELNAAIDEFADEIILPAGEFTADIYNTGSRDSLIIRGQGAETELAFANLQVRPSQFNSLTIENCTIERMPNKNWGHLVYGSSDNANGVYTIRNCVFNGVGSQGIYINENVDGATYNIENCVFNGDFGREGAITIQNNENVNVTVNVNGCTFNDVPDGHDIYVLYSHAGLNLKVDGKDYVTNNAQLAAAIANGATEVELQKAGTYTVPSVTPGSEVTIKGTEDTVINFDKLVYPSGNAVSTINFEGVTITGNAYTNGMAYTKSTFTDCVFKTVNTYLYNDTKFVSCDFYVDGDYYALWTWGAGTVEFVDCDFYTQGKAVYMNANSTSHKDGRTHEDVYFTDCRFYDQGDDTITNKAAIEIGDDYNRAVYNLYINNTTVDGFAVTEQKKDLGGTSLGTNVWGNKYLISSSNLNVVIDGVDVY